MDVNLLVPAFAEDWELLVKRPPGRHRLEGRHLSWWAPLLVKGDHSEHVHVAPGFRRSNGIITRVFDDGSRPTIGVTRWPCSASLWAIQPVYHPAGAMFQTGPPVATAASGTIQIRIPCIGPAGHCGAHSGFMNGREVHWPNEERAVRMPKDIGADCLARLVADTGERHSLDDVVNELGIDESEDDE